MSFTKNKSWFTLIELMVAITIVSIITMSWFSVLNNAMTSKVFISEKIQIEKNAFVASEKFFELIKKGGTIDYEEYFNRDMLWDAQDQYWNFLVESKYWNEWDTEIYSWTPPYFYYCRSITWNKVENWCNEDIHQNIRVIDESGSTSSNSMRWTNQIYWQYSFNFIDYNSNFDKELDNDKWDENYDGNIIWDLDDTNLGVWPVAFTPEDKEFNYLYLVNPKTNERTFFEYRKILDPAAPTWITCPDSSLSDPERFCMWQIIIKRMAWKDWGQTVSLTWTKDTSDPTFWDWVIDTWIVHPEVSWKDESVDIESQIAHLDDDSDWISNIDEYAYSIFPDTINVKSIKYRVYPNIDSKYAWKALPDAKANISPFIRMEMVIAPSQKGKARFNLWDTKSSFSTTINLNNYK